METARERHLRRQLDKFEDADLEPADWLDRHPNLATAARAVFEAGLARAAVRRESISPPAA